ncbi:MAG: hypothetical protein J5940_05325 [Clostridia bacterium]|nr:hypothetical protein [Clostridia bacterium]
MNRKKVNVINFVRGCEPRYETDLVEPIREELRLCRKYRFRNTVLLQYDAMLRGDIMETVLDESDENTEFGVWIEMARALCEKVGLEWRGREGWDWDWHIVPGFLMAYTQDERKLLCDEIMRLFYEKFGYYPKSAGSWLLDGFSIDYMAEKYGVRAFCVCRDQDNTDAYTLWGGYFNGGYYPSKTNMLSPAVDMKNAVKVPVFRMLCPDPIYNYLNTVRPKRFKRGPYTLEPTWGCGQMPDVIAWYFRWFCDDRCLAMSYMQLGQENSFPWNTVKDGLSEQLRQLSELRDAGYVSVEQLCETGEFFTGNYKENVPQALLALDDWDGNGCKSVWYMSRFYRANLFYEDGKLYFRDIHKNSDGYKERYYDTVCMTNPAVYDTLPVCDGWNLKGGDASGRYELGSGFSSLSVEKKDDKTLVVNAVGERSATVTFGEDRISVSGSEVSFAAEKGFAGNIVICDGNISMKHRGYGYSVYVDGVVKPLPAGYGISGKNGSIDIYFDR